MKITVYSSKGGAGKTPISVNMVFDREYAIGTNETFDVLASMENIPEDRVLKVSLEEAFPQIPDDIDIVFDLAGSLARTSASISSAVEQSDLVVVPIYDEFKSITAGVNTVLQLQSFNVPILVVATKLEKGRKEIFIDWGDSESFRNIESIVQAKAGKGVTVLPLKKSKVFDIIFEEEKSIQQLRDSNGLDHKTYREVSEQFEAIYSFIDSLS